MQAVMQVTTIAEIGGKKQQTTNSSGVTYNASDAQGDELKMLHEVWKDLIVLDYMLCARISI